MHEYYINQSIKNNFISTTQVLKRTLTERLCVLTKILLAKPDFFIIIFYCTMNRKRSGTRIFPQIASFSKKASIKSDQHHFPVQRSRVISGLSVVTWSSYMRKLPPDDCVVIVNQWACEHRSNTSIQIPGRLLPQ